MLLLPVLVAQNWGQGVMAQSAGASPAAAGSQTSPVGIVRQLLPFDVQLNQTPLGVWPLLIQNEVYYANGDTLSQWRLLPLPDASGLLYRGDLWYPISALPGFTATVNEAQQQIAIRVSPEAFQVNTVAGLGSRSLTPSPVLPALFLNSDLSLDRTQAMGLQRQGTQGGIFELGASSGLGLFTTSHVYRSSFGLGQPGPTSERLETRLTKNFVEDRLTLRLGDSITRPSLGGRSLFFGGLQFGRNYALAPGFITAPIPIISGSASTPSTVELYVNDAIRRSSPVPSGPFTIDNFPLVGAGGDVRVVVRDALGRETVIERQFYSGTSLLEEGIDDFSLESGSLRQDAGTAQARYGRSFLSGLYRYGLSKTQTVELNFQGTNTLVNGAVSWAQALPYQSLAYLQLGHSEGQRFGTGRSQIYGLERIGRVHGFSAQRVRRGRNFEQVGLAGNDTMSDERLYTYSYADPSLGALGLSFGEIKSQSRGDTRSLVGTYTQRILDRASLTFSVAQVNTPEREVRSTGVTLTVPLGGRAVSSSNYTFRSNSDDFYTGVNQGPPGFLGDGYRLITGRRNQNNFYEGGYFSATPDGDYSVDVSAGPQQSTSRFGYRGGVLLVGGELAVSRPIRDGIGLVQAPGLQDVAVLVQGQEAGRLNESGVAVITGLLPFQENRVRLKAQDIPISVDVGNLEMPVVPGDRTASRLAFEVKRGQSILLSIRLDDGRPAPAGAEVTVRGQPESFLIARKGEVFLSGLDQRSELMLEWMGQKCSMSLVLDKPNADQISRVGPLLCAGVNR